MPSSAKHSALPDWLEILIVYAAVIGHWFFLVVATFLPNGFGLPDVTSSMRLLPDYLVVTVPLLFALVLSEFTAVWSYQKAATPRHELLCIQDLQKRMALPGAVGAVALPIALASRHSSDGDPMLVVAVVAVLWLFSAIFALLLDPLRRTLALAAED